MNIEKIYHIADLHIRNYQRHDEYRKVFSKFLERVNSDGIENSIIYIGGDIAHAKTDMSPELVSQISWFLTECAKLREVILITGNHDCNLNNTSRLDVLTPIVENLNNNRVHYLRDTGVYNIHNLTFVVYSILDNKENWPKASDIVGENKICLFHGPVNKAKTDIGYIVSSNSFTAEMFDGFDMVMMGDIHKRQNLGKGYEYSAYCGSLVQQNHGELLNGHGYLLWDVKNRTYEEYDIYNEFGYITIDIDGGIVPQWVFDEEKSGKLPKNLRVRIRYSDTDPSQLKLAITQLKRIFNVVELTVTRLDTISKLKNGNGINKNIIGNVRDLDFQTKLLHDYLSMKIHVTTPDIEEIIKINYENNGKLNANEYAENIVWVPKKFEFSNMFSYGEDNIVRFDKAKGVVGIFAPNASGKSSLFDALSFCIFDRTSRTNIAKQILNNQKDVFYCKFNFEIDGVDYYIERIAKSVKKDQNIKVDVNFWRVVDGNTESLNGEQRRDTNRNIEKYLGKFEDFILTTLSLQGNNALFVDKSQSERKEILSQFIGLDVFDKLYTNAYEANKETTTLIKRFKTDDFTQRLAEIDDSITKVSNEYSLANINLSNTETEITQIQDKISVLKGQLHKISFDNLDISVLNTELKSTNNEIGVVETQITNLEADINNYNILLDGYTKEIQKYDKALLEINIKASDDINKSLNNTVLNLNNTIEAIRVSENIIEKLNSHKYNKNCDVCIENSKSIIEQLNGEVKRLDELNELKNKYNSDIHEFELLAADFGKYKDDYTNYTHLSNNITTVNLSISKSETNLHKLESKLINLKTKRSDIEKLIEEYNFNEIKITENKNVNKSIKLLEDFELADAKKQLEKDKSVVLDKNGLLSTLKNEKQNLENKIKEIEQLETENRLYEYYLNAISKDGISYDLIQTALPKIEEEVNNILSQIVDFTVEMRMDGKNINANLSRDGRSWSLEMCSGMERFISGLAIRVALINVCNLPRPNFLILDEGFGTLDSDNLQSLTMLFSYLKTQFDFIIVISHIENMRDMVDSSIDIVKDMGLSKIKY
jgi:DNA repair exonuclease SbcCD ATPase subunit